MNTHGGHMMRGNADFEPSRPELMSGHHLELMRNGHGWVVPRPDGTKANCGGPSLCRVCHLEKLVFSTADRVTVMEGFRIQPGDKVLLIAPPTSNKRDVDQTMEHLTKRFPEVHFTVVGGFTGVQVHKEEPTV